MKVPRDLSGEELVKVLEQLGYVITRQSGSHIRLTYKSSEKIHHLTIPNHKTLKVGIVNSILKEVARELNLSIDEIKKLF
ncbi:type II toxin-antitoxin system HicA family toxin [Pseudothermotoga thermarum]|uniref:YcfA family protein n=1 Tax=Pseudothermotoga thermarum DSM 5069 TaxID=688269 RepID=F7YTS2_9THEM|nr:type II toxin-antitoxin system HicA family toxin [Pseudothermotoga thermarum]AEH51367.1 YcfA family protein [Pseudothermotoga thermarum DSM 5069]